MNVEQHAMPDEQPPAKLQFTLGTLLLATTLACVCLAIAARDSLVGAPLTVLTIISTFRAFAAARYDVERRRALLPSVFAGHFLVSFIVIWALFTIGAMISLPVLAAVFLLIGIFGIGIHPHVEFVLIWTVILTSIGLLLRAFWPRSRVRIWPLF